MTIKKHTKNLRHKQMKKELKQRKKAEKVKEGRKPFCKWETKRSLRKKLESMDAMQKMLNEAEDTAEMWQGLYKSAANEIVELNAEIAALRMLLAEKSDENIVCVRVEDLGVSA